MPQRQPQLPEAPGPPRNEPSAMTGSLDPMQSGLPDGVAASCSTPAPGHAAPVGYAAGIACAVYVGIANGSFLVSGGFKVRRPGALVKALSRI